ncbi:hypothetical protein H8957_017104, partial [Semnopithecus entellus]
GPPSGTPQTQPQPQQPLLSVGLGSPQAPCRQGLSWSSPGLAHLSGYSAGSLLLEGGDKSGMDGAPGQWQLGLSAQDCGRKYQGFLSPLLTPTKPSGPIPGGTLPLPIPRNWGRPSCHLSVLSHLSLPPASHSPGNQTRPIKEKELAAVQGETNGPEGRRGLERRRRRSHLRQTCLTGECWSPRQQQYPQPYGSWQTQQTSATRLLQMIRAASVHSWAGCACILEAV